jgi:hypothetical protein
MTRIEVCWRIGLRKSIMGTTGIPDRLVFCMWRMTGVWGRVARKSADGELWDEHRREYYGAPWTTNLNYCRVGEVFWERGMIFAWESDNGRLLG